MRGDSPQPHRPPASRAFPLRLPPTLILSSTSAAQRPPLQRELLPAPSLWPLWCQNRKAKGGDLFLFHLYIYLFVPKSHLVSEFGCFIYLFKKVSTPAFQVGLPLWG